MMTTAPACLFYQIITSQFWTFIYLTLARLVGSERYLICEKQANIDQVNNLPSYHCQQSVVSQINQRFLHILMHLPPDLFFPSLPPLRFGADDMLSLSKTTLSASQ